MCSCSRRFSLFSCLYCCKRSFVDSPLLTFITVHKFNIANIHTHRDSGVVVAPLLFASFTAKISQFYASRIYLPGILCASPENVVCPPAQFEIARCALIKSVDTTLNVENLSVSGFSVLHQMLVIRAMSKVSRTKVMRD